MIKKKSYLKLFSLIFFIIFCCAFQTIVYSAINSTFKINGDAYARVEADVRITGFRLVSTNNATSSYEAFGKTHVATEIDLINNSSSITYYLEITNYGSAEVGIFDITGIPNGVNYAIKDYNLKDKICDDSGKCNNFAVKTYEITLSTTGTYSGNVKMDFEFKQFYSITYSGMSNNNYVLSIMDGEDLNVTFISDIPNRINIYVDNIEIDRSTYTYDNTTGKLLFQNVSGNLTIEKAESTLINGQTFSVNLKNFVNGTADATYSSYDTTVTYIGIYEDDIPSGYTSDSFFSLPYIEVSENGRVKAYHDNGKVYIYSIDDILAPKNSYSLFRGYTNLVELNILELDTRNVENAQSMFNNLSSLQYLDLSNFVTHNMSHMLSMISDLKSLLSLDLSNFDTSKVRNMSMMFIGCNSLVSIDLSGFNTSNVIDMSWMFYNCNNLKSLDISTFDTSKVTDMSRMFGYTNALTKIYVGDGWNTSQVTNSEKMFNGAELLPNYDSSVVDITKAHYGEGGYLSRYNTVSIEGTLYTYEGGMTWEEWVESEYNTIGLYNWGGILRRETDGAYFCCDSAQNGVNSSSLIDDSKNYYFKILPPGSGN